MVDEVYYSPAAKSLLEFQGDPNYVHPPLGKLLIASGIALFGYNSFGWRLASVIAGSIIVPATYLFARKIFGDFVGIMSAALLIFDPMQQTMSRIAMLDIFLALFITLAFLAASYEKYRVSSMALGLACGVKLVGAFAIVGIATYLICRGRITKVLGVIPVFAATFAASLIPIVFDRASFLYSIAFSTSWHMTLDASHPSVAPPVGWLVNMVPFPVYSSPQQSISVSSNPFLYPISVAVVVFLVYQALNERKCMPQTLPVFWFTFVYGLFFLIPRKTQFMFYLTPAVPAILVLASYGIFRFFSSISK